MSDTLRWGLLSTARINRSLIPSIRQSARSELIAVASRDRARAERYAHTWGIPRAYGSYQALLEDPDIDAVYISLPNRLHGEWTVRAAQADKHVLCEKPLVPTLEELDEIEATAHQHQVTVFEAFMYLHHPQTLKAQAMVSQGQLGRPQLIQSWFSFYLPPEQADNIRLSPELAGGSLWDVGVYPNSMAITLAGGLPLEVWAHQIIGETGVDITLTGQMRFSNTLVAQISSSFRMPFRQGAVIVGEDASLVIPEPWKPGSDGRPSRILLQRWNGEAEQLEIPPVDPYLCEVQAMEACVLQGAEPVVPLQRSRKFLRSVLALYRSAQAGNVVTLQAHR